MRRVLVLALGAAIAATGFAAQAGAAPAPADPSVSAPGWKAPRNAFGQPDLSGFWTNASLTPLTRNTRLTNKPVLSEAEAKAQEKTWAEAVAEANSETPVDELDKASAVDKSNEKKLVAIRPDFQAAGGDVGGYNSFWLDPGSHIMKVNGEYRTAVITTPNGLPPPRKKGAPPSPGFGRDAYDSYETRSTGERCITSFGRNAGPPMLSNGYYNNGYQILQTPTDVVIHVELIHDIRVVRLNGKHRTDGLRPAMGDSIGWWEGDTLVVETTNLPQRDNFFGAWKNLKVTERFTRVSKEQVNYKFTVEDSDVWDAPWGGEYNFSPYKAIYEYACHEGNYALPGILAGARELEKVAKAAQAAPPPAPAAAPAPAKGKPGG
jgi:hypothetical protein